MRGYCKLLNFLAFSVQINPSPTTDVVPPLPKRARVFRSYSLDDLALGESYQSSSKRSFSIREKVAESRMRGHFKLFIFLAFPFTKFPHPPLTWSPLSQNGRGFSEVTVLMI